MQSARRRPTYACMVAAGLALLGAVSLRSRHASRGAEPVRDFGIVLKYASATQCE